MKDLDRKGLRTWIEIDTKTLDNNYKVLRASLPSGCKLMSVSKSNAYGHSLVDFSKEIEKLGADWIGVDSVVEAITLREESVKIPILVLGYTLPEMLEKASDLNISLGVSTFETLNAIEQSNFSKKLKIHIKVDTGMHRQGFQDEEIESVIEKIKKLIDLGKIELEGIFTHFAEAKNPESPHKTLEQLSVFKEWTDTFSQAGFSPIKHACASGGALIFSQAHFDMVRMGISMYGIYPSKEAESFSKNKVDIKPILSWRTIMGEVKKVPKGDSVGYDFTEEFKRDSVIAVCPVGYWHGYPRALSGISYVLVKGVRAKILGRISMDMIVIDVTDVQNPTVGDVVTLIGDDGNESVTAVELADLMGGSPYELITRLNPLIKRIYV